MLLSKVIYNTVEEHKQLFTCRANNIHTKQGLLDNLKKQTRSDQRSAEKTCHGSCYCQYTQTRCCCNIYMNTWITRSRSIQMEGFWKHAATATGKADRVFWRLSSEVIATDTTITHSCALYRELWDWVKDCLCYLEFHDRTLYFTHRYKTYMISYDSMFLHCFNSSKSVKQFLTHLKNKSV